MPIDLDEVQCSVCGEVLPRNTQKMETTAPPPQPDAPGPAAPKLEITPGMVKIAVVWMVCCVLFAIVCIALAFHEFSIEAMWASFIAAGLAGLPLLYIVLGRTVEVVYWYRKELTVMLAIAGGTFCVYLIARAIMKSNIQIETTGMQQLITNENFTKTLVTAIICITVIAVLIPAAKMLLRSSTTKAFVSRYDIETEKDKHSRASENSTAVELRRLELAHEAEMRRLEVERERIRLEAEHKNLLAHESRLMIENKEAQDQTPEESKYL